MGNNYMLTREGTFITVSDDELYHFKYLKREKVNGKWRYFYNNEEYQAWQKTQSAVKKDKTDADYVLGLSRKDINEEAKNLAKASVDKQNAQRELNKKYGMEYGYDYTLDYFLKNQKELMKMSPDEQKETIVKAIEKELASNSEYQKLKAEVDRTTANYDKALEEYEYDAEQHQAIINENWTSGVRVRRKEQAAKKAYEKTTGAKVSTVLNKSSDKIDKAKTYIDKLMSKKKK